MRKNKYVSSWCNECLEINSSYINDILYNSIYSKSIYKSYTKMRSRFLPLLNIICYIIMIVINALGSTGKLGGKPVAEVSDKYYTILTPAGWTFSVWGLLYTLQAIWLVTQIPSMFLAWDNTLSYGSIGILYIIQSLLNTAWIILWTRDTAVTTAVANLLIGLIWITIIVIYISLDITYGLRGRFRTIKSELYPNGRLCCWDCTPDIKSDTLNIVSRSCMERCCMCLFDEKNRIIERTRRPISLWEYWIIQSTFSCYLSWLTGAVILNTGSTLVAYNSDIGKSYVWGIFWISFLTCLSIAMLVYRRDFLFTGIFAWTLGGIISGQNDTFIRGSAITACIIVTFSTVLVIIIQIYEFILYPPTYITLLLFNDEGVDDKYLKRIKNNKDIPSDLQKQVISTPEIVSTVPNNYNTGVESAISPYIIPSAPTNYNITS